VIATALKGSLTSDGAYPETPHVRKRQAELHRSMRHAGLALAGVATGAALLWWLQESNIGASVPLVLPLSFLPPPFRLGP